MLPTFHIPPQDIPRCPSWAVDHAIPLQAWQCWGWHYAMMAVLAWHYVMMAVLAWHYVMMAGHLLQPCMTGASHCHTQSHGHPCRWQGAGGCTSGITLFWGGGEVAWGIATIWLYICCCSRFGLHTKMVLGVVQISEIFQGRHKNSPVGNTPSLW